jgi:riboflavin kinase/FMN adenylyltransferase
MEIVTSLKQPARVYHPCAIALGTFDGLHKGHVDVIKTAGEYARTHGLKLVVFTFSNHPYSYIRPHRVPVAIISETGKLAILKSLGVDTLLEIPFDDYLANLTANDFLKALQVFNYHCLVVGENFSYGYMGAGNTDSLRMEGFQHNFEVIVRPLMQENGHVISSTSIRTLVQYGNLSWAAKMLGRPYAVYGNVVHGFARGRKLGFPTANLRLDRTKVALPPDGVYAVTITTPAGCYKGMANLGTNPTFGDVPKELLEVHLLGFEGDLYDQYLQVNLLKFIRMEQKFADLEALKTQVQADLQVIAGFFKENKM